MANPAEYPVAALLGGPKVLGGIAGAHGLVQVLRRGLPYASLQALSDLLKVDLGEVSAVVGIATRTLGRRKHEKQLSPIESDRLYRVASVTQLAVEALGGVEKAGLWLKRPNRSLGGEAPFSLLDTEIGVRQVEQALLQLNYGIFT